MPTTVNFSSRWLAVLGYFHAGALIRVQSPRLPVFTPLPPLTGMPDSSVDHRAL